MTDPATLVDREQEKQRLFEFFREPASEPLFVTGPSGTGKSFLVSCSFDQFYSNGQRIGFSFEDCRAEEGAPFVHFLSHLYRQARKGPKSARKLLSHVENFGRLDAMILKVPVPFGPSFFYSFHKGPRVDDDYVKQLFRTLKSCDIKVLHICNLEWLENPCDAEAIKTIRYSRQDDVKIVLEAGTLRDPSDIARNVIRLCHDLECLKVEPLRRSNAVRLYRQCHHHPPPEGFFEKTGGNALFIKHYQEELSFFKEYSFVEDTMKHLDERSSFLLSVVAILGGACRPELALEYAGNKARAEDLNHLIVTKRILDEEDDIIKFSHPLFYQHFLSHGSDYVTRLVRRRIIEVEEGRAGDDVASAYGIVHHSFELGDWVSFWRHAWPAVRTAYAEQRFELCIRVCRRVLAAPGECRAEFAHLVLTQCLVATGAFAEAEAHMAEVWEAVCTRLDVDLRAKATLIESQLLHETSRFRESMERLKPVMVEGNSEAQAIAFGLSAANYYCMGETNKGRDAYAAALRIAEESRLNWLVAELMRLSPRAEGPELSIVRLSEFIDSSDSDAFPFTKAKCLHNRATAAIWGMRGKGAHDDLNRAREILENYDSPFLSYTLGLLGILEIVEARYDRAASTLLDALNVAEFQYDRCAISISLGALSLLRGNGLEDARHWFEKAEDALDMGPYPLPDPEMRYAAAFNLALVDTMRGCFSEAQAQFAALPMAPSMRQSRPVMYWHERLTRAIENRSREIELRRSDIRESDDWIDEEFCPRLLPVSFFDLSVEAVRPGELPTDIVDSI